MNSYLAFVDEVPVEPHISEPAPEEHISTPSEEDTPSTPHTSTPSSEEDNSTSSSYDPTPFIYPYWMYASHPSTECQTKGTSCPQLSDGGVIALTIGGAIVVAIILGILYLIFNWDR